MKYIIVTGAGKGLGLAISTQLLINGYGVIAISRSKTNEIENLLNQFPTSCYFIQYDFSDLHSISQLAKEIHTKFPVIFGLVNNAAVGFDGVLATMHESEITKLIDTNITAPILFTKYISRRMLMGGEGRVINISSIIASTGFSGLSVYAASKSALIGFTKSLSRELGRANITVNAVCPGYMRTTMTQGLEGEKLKTIQRRSPLGHLATVEDVAHMVTFLLSENAKNITGTNFTVDAGSTA